MDLGGPFRSAGRPCGRVRAPCRNARSGSARVRSPERRSAELSGRVGSGCGRARHGSRSGPGAAGASRSQSATISPGCGCSAASPATAAMSCLPVTIAQENDMGCDPTRPFAACQWARLMEEPIGNMRSGDLSARVSRTRTKTPALAHLLKRSCTVLGRPDHPSRGRPRHRAGPRHPENTVRHSPIIDSCNPVRLVRQERPKKPSSEVR